LDDQNKKSCIDPKKSFSSIDISFNRLCGKFYMKEKAVCPLFSGTAPNHVLPPLKFHGPKQIYYQLPAVQVPAEIASLTLPVKSFLVVRMPLYPAKVGLLLP
jgi:hypothetical protein